MSTMDAYMMNRAPEPGPVGPNLRTLRLRRAERLTLALGASGGTVDPNTGEPITRGYAVGGVVPSVTVPANSPLVTSRAIAGLLRSLDDLPYRDGQRYGLGAWDDGDLCLDIVSIVASADYARELATARGETAFGDLAAYARGEDGTRYV